MALLWTCNVYWEIGLCDGSRDDGLGPVTTFAFAIQGRRLKCGWLLAAGAEIINRNEGTVRGLAALRTREGSSQMFMLS